MKKIFLVFGLIILMSTGCRKIKQDNIVPTASFSVDLTTPETNQNIHFTNQSSDADTYLWDFGDGTTSTDVDPVHYYTAEGSYTTTLTAYRNNGNSDNYQLTIDVYNTVLEVTVAEWNVNYYLDNLIPDAAVTLYLTYGDWYDRTNAVETEYTNSSGVAVFPQLQPIVYYIDVNSTYYNNSALGQEPGHSFIETLALIKAQINTFTAWVDYVGKKAEKTDGTWVPYKTSNENRTYKLVTRPK
jgi:PKD repeat protein